MQSEKIFVFSFPENGVAPLCAHFARNICHAVIKILLMACEESTARYTPASAGIVGTSRNLRLENSWIKGLGESSSSVSAHAYPSYPSTATSAAKRQTEAVSSILLVFTMPIVRIVWERFRRTERPMPSSNCPARDFALFFNVSTEMSVFVSPLLETSVLSVSQ